MPSNRTSLIPGLMLLVALTVATYTPVTLCGFIWDDDHYVTENMTLRDVQGLWRIWTEPGAVPQYYPLVHSTFWIEYHLWGLHPLGYHVVNVLLHAGVACCWWLVLRRLGVPGAAAGAWLAAAVFAVHPVHVESVAWVTERKNVLSGVFYLLAALAYLRFSPPEEGEAPTRGRLSWWLGATLLFLCALLAKTVTCTLPAALVLVLWWKRKRFPWHDLVWLTPLLVLGAALGLHTAHMEKHVVGAVGESWNFSAWQRVILAGKLVWFYTGKLVWPEHLVFFYRFWPLEAGRWEQYYAPVSALLVIALLLLLRRVIGGGAVVGWLFFMGTLFPALGFFNVFPMQYSFAADHFQYLASMGVIAALCGGLTVVLWRGGVAGRGAWGLAAVVILSGLMVRSWMQLPAYLDAESLWRHTISRNPTAFAAYNNLGNLLVRTGRWGEGKVRLRQCYVQESIPLVYYNMGTAMVAAGRYEQSLPYYDRALKFGLFVADIHYWRGYALAKLSRLKEAEATLRKSLELRPGDVPARLAYAGVCRDLGQWEVALRNYQTLSELAAEKVEVWDNLGQVYQTMGRNQEAETAYRRALALDDGLAEVHSKLGLLLAQTGRPAEAYRHLRQAVTLRPDHAAAWANLGALLSGAGQAAEAIGAFRRAIHLDPSRAVATRSLAWLLATSGEPGHGKEAVVLARRAMQMGAADDPLILDTLAAALAGDGQFEAAIAAARQAIVAAQNRNRPQLADAIARRLIAYQQQRPWREPPLE